MSQINNQQLTILNPNMIYNHGYNAQSRTIELNGKGIDKIDLNAFKDHYELDNLILNNNNIIYLESKRFIHLFNLKVLDLSINFLIHNIIEGPEVFNGPIKNQTSLR